METGSTEELNEDSTVLKMTGEAAGVLASPLFM